MEALKRPLSLHITEIETGFSTKYDDIPEPK